MNTSKFDVWPVGKLPLHWQRPELQQVKDAGYNWSDPREVVDLFEKKVAKFAGSRYAVAVDCCTHGLFLSLKWLDARGLVEIPKHTYQSVPMYIKHAGCTPIFRDEQWSGVYQLKPWPIYDCATRWQQGMYQGGLWVVSFQIKKRVPIGRGGMILTDDEKAYRWLIEARHDGRDMSKTQWEDDTDICGWHMYMTPEDAARGILLMDQVPDHNPDSATWENYADLSVKKLWRD